MSKIEKYSDFIDRFDNHENVDELEAGAQIQSEHEPTYNLIKKYFDKYGELPDKDWVFKSIAADHQDEFDDYYNRDYGLQSWEEQMKKRKNTGRKFDEEGENLIVQDIQKFENFKLNEDIVEMGDEKNNIQKYIELVDEIIWGKDNNMGILDGLDSYYRGSWNDQLTELEILKTEILQKLNK
jgi:hypothetical protein